MNDLVSTLMEYFEEAKTAGYSEAMMRWDLNKIVTEHDRQVENDLKDEIIDALDSDVENYCSYDDVVCAVRDA